MTTITYQFIDETRRSVSRLVDGQPTDAIHVETVTNPEQAHDPRWGDVMRWVAEGNVILPPPDMSDRDELRRLARQALQGVNWQHEVDTIAAGRVVVAQIQATLAPGRTLVAAIRNDSAGIPNATTRNRLADVLAGMIDNHERAAVVLDGSIDKIEMMGGWWHKLMQALAMADGGS